MQEGPVALSEQERKLLEQLEASLTAEDPKFAETLRGDSHVRIHRRRATLAGLGFLVGIVVLVAGMQIHPAVSVVGFVCMLAAAIIGISSWQRVSNEEEGAPRPKSPTSSPTGGHQTAPTSQQDFMNKLEERWRKRQEGGDS